MKDFVEKLIKRLEKLGWIYADYYPDETAAHRQRKKSVAYDEVVKIVNQLTEEDKDKYVRRTTLNQYMWERDTAISQLSDLGFGFGEKVGWIPCEKELPKTTNSYLVTKMCENNDNPIYETAHEVFYISDEKWDCERDEYCEWKVIAWQNKLKPYKPKTSETEIIKI